MLVLIYIIISFIFVYINATACYIRGVTYPWKQDIPLCLIWPVVVPVWIINLINSDDPECSQCHNKASIGHKMSCGKRYNRKNKQ